MHTVGDPVLDEEVEPPDDQRSVMGTVRVRSMAVVVMVMIVCMVVIDFSKSRQSLDSQWMAEDYVIDLNLATEAELNLLPGVGPKLAGDILRYRQNQGPFTKPEELQKIPGIKRGRFEAMKKHIFVQELDSRSAESTDESPK
jgi:competence ComEA-like helix-hairpin-helix protein